MKKRRMCLAGVLFWALSSGVASAQSSETDLNALNKRLESLQNQITDLQAQIANISEQNKAVSTGNSFAQQRSGNAPSSGKEEIEEELNKQAKHELGEAVETYETFSQDQQAAPRVDNAPLDPNYPGYFRLPGTQTLLKIGGYFKTDFIRDLRPAGDPERFIPGSIPIPTTGNGTNSTVSVRPTRLNLDFLVPIEDFGSVRFFVEGDLFGSSSTTPRLRHAYAQVSNLLIGQTFSNFQDPDAGPDQLDFQGPNSQVSLRNPQFRYSIPIAKRTSFRLALEKASSDIAFTTPEFNAQPSNQTPDGTATFRQDFDRGHLQVSSLFRSVGAFLPNGRRDSVFGWGFNVAGSAKIVGKDTLVFQGAYGNGIERYFNDTSGEGEDAAPKSTQDPHLKALPVVATYGAYQHFWTERVRSSIIYGYIQIDNTVFQPGTVFHQSNYSAANLIWNPRGSFNVGAEFLYGWQVLKNGQTGNAPRLMLSAKYNFVKSGTTAK
jgi:cell division protein FtsB